MTRVALFGGSFNPPHIAHELVALYVLETQPVDELWFVPVYQHVFGKELAPFRDRVAMCKLVAKALGPRAKVSRAEETLAKRPGFQGSRTLDLIEHLHEAHPGIELRLLIGSDILGDTKKWYRWDAVAAAAPPIVIERPGYPVPKRLKSAVPMPDISSTQIRKALASGRRLGDLLPARVMEYIEAKQLYR